MSQREDLLARLTELDAGTTAHRATARSIQKLINHGDYAAATTALDDLETALHPALAAGSGPGGSGLPEQWTDGGNGNVTAEADPTFVPLTVVGPDISTPGIVVRGAVGSAAEGTALVETRDEDDNVLVHLDSGGIVVYEPGGPARFSVDVSGRVITNADGATVGAGNLLVIAQQGKSAVLNAKVAGTGVAVYVNSPGPGDCALALGPWDETTDAINVVAAPDYNGGEYRVWGDGKFSTKAHTAPADGDIAAGECVFWFDQTNGAAKFMIKAKQADGTVRTGQVALS